MSNKSSLEGLAVVGVLLIAAWWLINLVASLVVVGIERVTSKK